MLKFRVIGPYFLVPLFLLLSQKVTSQTGSTIRFSKMAVYRLSYIRDSLNPVSKESYHILLLGKDTSLFAGYGNLNWDTSFYLKKQRGEKTNNSNQDIGNYASDADNQFRIFKTKDEILTYARLFPSLTPTVYYTEPKNSYIQWEVKSDTQTIDRLLCQRAECDFGGRHWTAWFTSSIPINDGPYKFSGLPGLIIQIYDNNKSWGFTLVEFKSSNYYYPMESLYRGVWKNQMIQFGSKNDFLKKYRNSQENAFELNQQYVKINFFGKEQQERDLLKKRAKEDNNWIELPDKK